MNYENLKATIAANIYQNASQEVSANMVKTAIDAAVDSLGAGYQYLGVATPATNPGSPDYKCFYIATAPGDYENFGAGISVGDGEVAILKYDTAWTKEVTGAASAASVTELGQKVEKNVKALVTGYIGNDGFERLDGFVTDSGEINTSNNYARFIIDNNNYKSISVVAAASNAMSVIAFFNSTTLSSSTLISNVVGISFATTTPYVADIPAGCVRIVVSNYTNYLAAPTISLYTSAPGCDSAEGTSFDDTKTGLGDNVQDAIDNIFGSVNLININAPGVLSGYFVYGSTITANAGYNTTDYIPVVPGADYSFFSALNYKLMRFITWYDAAKAVIDYAQNTTSVTLPNNARFVRISLPLEQWGRTAFMKGNLALNNVPYAEKIASKRIPQAFWNGYRYKKNTLVAGHRDTLFNCHIGRNYMASILLTSPTTITDVKIGFGYNDYSEGYIELDATYLKTYANVRNPQQTSQEHGLTIGERTYINIRVGEDGIAHITLCSMGSSFSCDVSWRNVSGQLFVENVAGPYINYEISFIPNDLERKIWVFGDSYYGFLDSVRFPYYLLEKGYNKWLLNHMPGIASTTSLANLKNLLDLCRNKYPNYILWGLGMNDTKDSDIDTPSATWLANTQEVISLCEERNIIPILATIPSALAENVTPNVLYYHEAKSKWIRESGYRYVDFAASVGAQADGTWYPGCKASDIHPSALGAKMMAEQCIVDFPEIAIQ